MIEREALAASFVALGARLAQLDQDRERFHPNPVGRAPMAPCELSPACGQCGACRARVQAILAAARLTIALG